MTDMQTSRGQVHVCATQSELGKSSAAEFVKKSVAEFQRDAARAGNPMPALKVASQVTPDHEKHLVNVTLNIKQDTTAPPAKP